MHSWFLDLLCSTGLNDVSVSGSVYSISGHILIEYSFPISTPPSLEKISVSFHHSRSVNSSLFAASLQSSSLSDLHKLSSPESMVSLYNDTISELLSDLALLKNWLVPASRSCPWVTPELRVMKAMSWCLKCHYKKTGLTVHSVIHGAY